MKAERLVIAKKTRRIQPARSMRDAVKNRGEELVSVHLPRVKTLDQTPYIRRIIHMRPIVPGTFGLVKKIVDNSI